MRSLLLLSLVVLVTFQSACERDAATAPQQGPLVPTAQVVGASTVPSRIAFEGNANGGGIFVMAADGTGLTQLTQSDSHHQPRWSPDGRQIAFTFQAPFSGVSNVYVMAADGSAITPLTNGSSVDRGPSWSPDGQQIAFESARDGNSEIYVMNADGSAPTRLTDNPAIESDPSWSPDGRHIAFWSTRDGNREIYVMGADGSAPTRLTNDAANEADDEQPTWSPDGRKIVFRRQTVFNVEIYVMNADGSDTTRLTNNGSFDGDPSWSPVRRIAFSSTRFGSREIFTMNPDGSVAKVLRHSGFSISRSPSWWPWLDRTPPQLPPPGAYTEAAERWFGRVFVYSRPRATDDLDPNPDVACTPPAGSIFPIGTTRVDCTATDNAGNIGTGYLTVTIRGPYEELGRVSAQLNVGSGERVKDALTKTEAARADFAQTPPDRTAALGDLLGVVDNLGAALTAGELSPSGYRDLVSQVTRVARLAADQSIAEAEARGGNAAAITDAKDALATGDARFSFGEYSDAVAQYRKACRAATGA